MGNERYVAPDARAVLEAFRRSGAPSFHEVGVAQARASYELSCQANGVELEHVAHVTDIALDDGPRLRLYRPEGQDTSAIALFLHGGGWVIGSLETHDRLCRHLAACAGIAVLAVDYRLAPEHPYPAAIDDARAAETWLRSNAVKYGLDLERLAIVGDSAGGQLAAVLAREDAARGVDQPARALVLLYPVTDVGGESASYARIDSDFPLTGESMRWFIQQYAPDPATRSDAALSPLRADVPWGFPPTFVCTVDNDPLADEGIAFAAKLAHAGVTVEHLHLAGYAHGLFTSAGKIATGRAVLGRVVRFLEDRLNH